MTLKNDYYDGVTGRTQQMEAAFAAGKTYVTTNLATLSTALKNYAAQGLTSFTVTVIGTGSLSGAQLRANNGNNLLKKSFFAGIVSGLAAESVFDYECTISLNVSDSVNTNIDFNFVF